MSSIRLCQGLCIFPTYACSGKNSSDHSFPEHYWLSWEVQIQLSKSFFISLTFTNQWEYSVESSTLEAMALMFSKVGRNFVRTSFLFIFWLLFFFESYCRLVLLRTNYNLIPFLVIIKYLVKWFIGKDFSSIYFFLSISVY